jgi:hypothetical protein
MKPVITSLNFTYKKEGTDVWVLNTDDIPVDKSLVKDQQIVHLGAGGVGGNHKHPRREWFIGLGPLELHWIDEDGAHQSTEMNPEGKLILFEIPPHLPHAVRNTSSNESGILFEYADDKMKNSERVAII